MFSHDQFGVEKVENTLFDFSVHGENWYVFFEDKLYSWFRNGVWEEQISLDFVDFMDVEYLVQFVVVAVVDLLEGREYFFYVLKIWVFRWCQFFDFPHE